MLDTVIIMLKRAAGIVWWVNEYALDLACELLLQRLQREKIVSVDQHVPGSLVAVGFAGVFHEYSGFQIGLLVLADPCEFEFLFGHGRTIVRMPLEFNGIAGRSQNNLSLVGDRDSVDLIDGLDMELRGWTMRIKTAAARVALWGISKYIALFYDPKRDSGAGLDRHEFQYFLQRQSRIHRSADPKIRKRNQRRFRKEFERYLEITDVAKGVIVAVTSRFTGRRTDTAAHSTSERLLQSAAFIQGMGICEEAITSAIYSQAGALVRQEMECIAAMRESREGVRVEMKTPNVKQVPWKMAVAYGQLSMMAHSSSSAMLNTMQHTEPGRCPQFASIIPRHNAQVAKMLIGHHAALMLLMAMELDSLYTDLYGEGLSPNEQDWIQHAIHLLQMEGFFKHWSGEDEIRYASTGDPEMDEAIAKAKTALPEFIAALQKPRGMDVCWMMVKGRFVEGRDIEHIWIGEVTYGNNLFHGVVMGKPRFISSIQDKQRVQVEPANVTDWMIIESGRKVAGGFVEDVLAARGLGKDDEATS